jgi:hypothetical protein
MKRKENALVKERQQLSSWYKKTQRVKLKMAIRQEIANIDKELRKLIKNRHKGDT